MTRNILRVDILDTNGVPVGAGPITTALSATVTRALDGAGSIKINSPGSESRAVDLMQNERRANVYLSFPGGEPRLVGSGVLRSVNTGGSASNWTLNASGPDLFDELKRYTTLLRREYSNQTASFILQDLASVAGWTVLVEAGIAGNLLTARYDGESVLKAFQTIVANYGYHARLGSTSKVIEVGQFGNSSGITAINAKQVSHQLYENDDIVLIDKITIKRNTENLINWIMPQGGGEGLAALTLASSTRTSPYVINSLVGPDGSTQYYLKDDTSIATYGISQKTGVFNDINPLDNTTASTVLGANALYDASAALLERASQRLDTYTLSIRKLETTLNPGDKLRVVYRGLIFDSDGKPIDFLDVDEELWVMKVTEKITPTNISAKLVVSTVDKQEFDSAKVIIGAIEDFKLKNLKVQPYPTTSPFIYLRQMDATHTADVPIEITNGTLYLDRCRVHLTTRPFRATAKAATVVASTVGTSGTSPAVTDTSEAGGGATETSSSGGASTETSTSGGASTETSDGGGDHRHKIANWLATGDTSNETSSYIIGGSDGASGPFNIFVKTLSLDPNNDMWTFASSGTHDHDVTIPNHTHDVTTPNHTHDTDIPSHTHEVTLPAHTHEVTVPAHGHDITYGIEDDSLTPDTISVAINGADRTAELGGPWAVGGGNADVVLEISQYLKNATGLPVQQKHNVVFSCATGQGEAEVLVELKTTVQSIQQTA